jgi:hypothetical protein
VIQRQQQQEQEQQMQLLLAILQVPWLRHELMRQHLQLHCWQAVQKL